MFRDLTSISWLMSTEPALLIFIHAGPISVDYCFDGKSLIFWVYHDYHSACLVEWMAKDYKADLQSSLMP